MRRRASTPLNTRNPGRQARRRTAAPDPVGDLATRERLLETARRLFVARGFKKVTVREITEEAHANIAAVSYHFRDKLGLYLEVVQEAITASARLFAATRAPDNAPAADRLRHYVATSLRRLADLGESKAWMQQIMSHEMMDPTPALPLIVDQALKPRLRYLADIVVDLLGCAPTDPRVGLCVASIHAQFVFHLRSPMRDIAFSEWRLEERSIDDIAAHIVSFSLAGVRGVR
ncbi:MAG: CerR family C-terminal domain-containing protein [Gemmatimonadaceae bacterium]